MTSHDGSLYVVDNTGDELWRINPDDPDDESGDFGEVGTLPVRLDHPVRYDLTRRARSTWLTTMADELWLINLANPSDETGGFGLVGEFPTGVASPNGLASFDASGDVALAGAVVGGAGELAGNLDAETTGTVDLAGDLAGGAAALTGNLDAQTVGQTTLEGSVEGGAAVLTGDLAFQGVGQANLAGALVGGAGALAGNLRAQAGVNTPPVVTFAVSTMRVDGRGTVVLTGSATDTQDAESALVFSWSAPSGTFRDSANASTVWTAPLPTTLEQSVSLTLTVTDTGGLSGTARVTIFVNAGAAPQPTAVGAAWNRPPGLRTDWSTEVWSTVPGTWDTFSGAGRAFSIDRGRGSEIDGPNCGHV